MWLRTSGIGERALFRRLVGRSRHGPRLHADIVLDIHKRLGEFMELLEDEVATFSGHSVQVGSTQALLALYIDLRSVMHAGLLMSMRYGEHGASPAKSETTPSCVATHDSG